MAKPWAGGVRGRKILMVAALVVSLITGALALFALPAQDMLFTPGAYQAVLDEQDAYRQFPVLLGEMMALGGDRMLFGGGEHLREVMRGVAVEQLSALVFPEDWVRAQSAGLLEQFWSFFNFQSPRLTLLVDLRPVKARLAGEGAQPLAAAILEGLPACTAEEVLNYVFGALSGEPTDLPLCRPPAELEGAAQILVAGILNSSAQIIPDQLDLTPALRFAPTLGETNVPAAFARSFRLYRFGRDLMRWLPWLWLGAVLLLGWLSWRTANGPVFWLGASFLGTGISTALLALLLGLTVDSTAGSLAGGIVGAQPVAFDLLAGMIAGVVERYARSVLLAALSAAGLGAALIAFTALRKKKRAGIETPAHHS